MGDVYAENHGKDPAERWRYQPVSDTQGEETLYYLIEVWVDDHGRLTTWADPRLDAAELPFSYPAGDSMAALQNDLVRMYVDAQCWAPVAFDSLRAGMTFQRIVATEERERLADALDAGGGQLLREAAGRAREPGHG